MKSGFKLHPKIWLFSPSQAYFESVHSVHTPKIVDLFFQNKIGTHGTQILRNKFGFRQIPPKMTLRYLFLKEKNYGT